jgi:hypothetical protein
VSNALSGEQVAPLASSCGTRILTNAMNEIGTVAVIPDVN